jgi:hypothetical protein
LEIVFGILTGIGLSAACGFRIFVPLLILNLASITGYFHLAPGFEWLGSLYATIAFGSATLLEVLAYYIPWFDNTLDTIASPVSVIAGIIITASTIVDLPPSLKWTLAIIAGGGVAGLIQGASAILRAKSSLFTGGIGNAVVATGELAGSLTFAILAIAVPVIAIIFVILFCIFAIYKTGRYFFRKMFQK